MATNWAPESRLDLDSQLLYGSLYPRAGVAESESSDGTAGSRQQLIFVADMISEGPIEGLVNGQKSIYLDGVPLIPNNFLSGQAANVSEIEATFVDTDEDGTNIYILIGKDGRGVFYNSFTSQAFLYSLKNYSVPATVLSVDTRNGRMRIRYTVNVGDRFVDFNTLQTDDSEYSPVGVSSALVMVNTETGLEEALVDLTSTDPKPSWLALDSNSIVTSGSFSVDLVLNLENEKVVGRWDLGDTILITPGDFHLIRQNSAPSPVDSVTIEETAYQNIFQASDVAKVYLYQDNRYSTSSRETTNLPSTAAEFRPGNVDQSPLTVVNAKGKLGGLAVVANLSEDLFFVSPSAFIGDPSIGYPEASLQGGYLEEAGLGEDTGEEVAESPTILKLSDPSIFGGQLTPDQIAQLDNISFNVQYASLGRTWLTDANLRVSYVHHFLFFAPEGVSTDGELSGEVIPVGEKIYHGASTNSPISFELDVDLTPYKPFNPSEACFLWYRTSAHGGEHKGVRSDGSLVQDESAGNALPDRAKLVSITGRLTESFTYPYLAYSGVQFRSVEYSSLPTRMYDCKGLKIKIPDNYFTRDENDSGVASYDRNPITGNKENQDQYWTGGFRSDANGKELKVYCNNPAWVLYDLLTNTRYGVGSWLKEEDIDIFSFYRVAKYCDELVPGQEGVLEPRFEANIYLVKPTDIFKVVKDFCTIFRGVLYWINGRLTPVVDQPRSPVASFGMSNVVGGQFEYSGTSQKVRPNQIIVSWINPDKDYQQDTIILEDDENIARLGKVVAENVVAFGCTSEGQAIRYAKWKLWTAANQKELVTFKTSMEGHFLTPGDVILVSDSNRHVKYKKPNTSYQPTRWSGRVRSGLDGTPITASTVPIDRLIELNPAYKYSLTVLITEASAMLAQERAEIQGETYLEGDYLPSSLYASEEEAINLKDDNNNHIQVLWNKYTRAETRDLPTISTSNEVVQNISVSKPFSVAPDADTIWVK